MTEADIMLSNPLISTIRIYDQTEVIPIDNGSIGGFCILFKNKGDALWAFSLDYEQTNQLISQLTKERLKTTKLLNLA